MIRTITDKKNIPSHIAKVLDMDHPRWLEKVLLLVGFYTAPKRAIRALKVSGTRQVRKHVQKHKAASLTRKTSKGGDTFVAPLPSLA